MRSASRAWMTETDGQSACGRDHGANTQRIGARNQVRWDNTKRVISLLGGKDHTRSLMCTPNGRRHGRQEPFVSSRRCLGSVQKKD